MRRLHLLEIEDQPWCPRAVRDAGTDFLQFALRVGRNYEPVVPHLRRLLSLSGSRRIVDLGSGAGGPWPGLHPLLLDGLHPPPEICLTDRYPNLPALERARSESDGRLAYRSDPVDAMRLPADLVGVRTMFSSFHHFAPEAARALLADAVRQRQPIAVFEATQRSVVSVLTILVSPLLVLLVTPAIRPFRWSRLLFTYLVPLVPLLVLFDGVVSCLRTYSTRELRELTAAFEGEAYRWEVGEERTRGPVPVTYLLGYPSAG